MSYNRASYASFKARVQDEYPQKKFHNFTKFRSFFVVIVYPIYRTEFFYLFNIPVNKNNTVVS